MQITFTQFQSNIICYEDEIRLDAPSYGFYPSIRKYVFVDLVLFFKAS